MFHLFIFQFSFVVALLILLGFAFLQKRCHKGFYLETSVAAPPDAVALTTAAEALLSPRHHSRTLLFFCSLILGKSALCAMTLTGSIIFSPRILRGLCWTRDCSLAGRGFPGPSAWGPKSSARASPNGCIESSAPGGAPFKEGAGSHSITFTEAGNKGLVLNLIRN